MGCTFVFGLGPFTCTSSSSSSSLTTDPLTGHLDKCTVKTCILTRSRIMICVFISLNCKLLIICVHGHMDMNAKTLTNTKNYLLIVLVDLRAEYWTEFDVPAIQSTLNSIIFCCNMFLCSSSRNRLVLRFFSGAQSFDVYQSSLTPGKLQLVDTRQAINAMKACFEKKTRTWPSDLVIPKQLSNILCMISREKLTFALDELQATILLIIPEQLVAPRYVPMMNCSFAAQKKVCLCRALSNASGCRMLKSI